MDYGLAVAIQLSDARNDQVGNDETVSLLVRWQCRVVNQQEAKNKPTNFGGVDLAMAEEACQRQG
jgi:hypothetical protein